MKEIYNNLELTDNATAHRFEMKVGDELAIIEYKRSSAVIMLLHTEVTPALEGKGAATAIIEKVLDYVETHHLKLVPLCPLIAAYIKKHPEWNRLVYEHS